MGAHVWRPRRNWPLRKVTIISFKPNVIMHIFMNLLRFLLSIIVLNLNHYYNFESSSSLLWRNCQNRRLPIIKYKNSWYIQSPTEQQFPSSHEAMHFKFYTGVPKFHKMIIGLNFLVRLINEVLLFNCLL